MGLRNMAGQLLTNGLTNALTGSQSAGNIEERGWAVGEGVGLDSMAVNAFFSHISGAVPGLGKYTTQALGIGYASLGGKRTRGHFIWEEPEGSPWQGTNRFTFPMNPESINESVAPTWAETEVPGQNRPMYQFINGGAREVSFTLNFFYQTRAREVIRDQINALKSLTQRRYTGRMGGAYDGPPVISFFYGDYFEDEKFIIASLQIKSFDLFDAKSLLPMRADVDVTLKEVTDTMAVSKGTRGNHAMLDNSRSLGWA